MGLGVTSIDKDTQDDDLSRSSLPLCLGLGKILRCTTSILCKQSVYNFVSILLRFFGNSKVWEVFSSHQGHCVEHGFCAGIVKAVDMKRGVFYISTPVPQEQLQLVDTLLQGRVEIPVPLLMVRIFHAYASSSQMMHPTMRSFMYPGLEHFLYELPVCIIHVSVERIDDRGP